MNIIEPQNLNKNSFTPTSIVECHTKKIYNSKGKKILKIPIGTLLDNIIIDLWSEITPYLDYHQFALGKTTKSYPGYRKLTQNDFDIDKFFDCHWKNKGFHTFDNIFRNAYVSVEGNYILKNGDAIQVTPIDYNRMGLLKIDTCDTKSYNLIKCTNANMFPYSEYLNLMVPDI